MFIRHYTTNRQIYLFFGLVTIIIFVFCFCDFTQTDQLIIKQEIKNTIQAPIKTAQNQQQNAITSSNAKRLHAHIYIQPTNKHLEQVPSVTIEFLLEDYIQMFDYRARFDFTSNFSHFSKCNQDRTIFLTRTLTHN